MNINVGPGTYGAEGISIFDWQQGATLEIGNYCSIAPGVTVLLGGNHRYNRVTTYPFNIKNGFGHNTEPDGYSNGNVIIQNDVWIGYGVTIMSGVTIGNGAIVAANAHIIKDVAPYTIVGGNPAKLIRNRFTPVQTNALLALAWWDWPLHKIEQFADLLLRPDIDDFINSASQN
jgi:acetyltransferase-like isoleucine patch superfamily enzyme